MSTVGEFFTRHPSILAAICPLSKLGQARAATKEVLLINDDRGAHFFQELARTLTQRNSSLFRRCFLLTVAKVDGATYTRELPTLDELSRVIANDESGDCLLAVITVPKEELRSGAYNYEGATVILVERPSRLLPYLPS